MITDPNTGEVLACVSYPGYDNNRLTNTMDSAYYAALNRGPLQVLCTVDATQQQHSARFYIQTGFCCCRTGRRGDLVPSEIIHATGVFTDAYGSPTCWIYNQYHGSHGNINMVDAIRVSCNYYFYEVGFRLGGGQINRLFIRQGTVSLLPNMQHMFGFERKHLVWNFQRVTRTVLDRTEFVLRSDRVTHLYTVSQLARYVSTIANRGTVYNLTLLDKLTDSEGNTIEDYSASVYNKIEIADD